MPCVRIAAAGDIHARPESEAGLRQAFAAVGQKADLVLLAGDLTNEGVVAEAEVVARAAQSAGCPVLAVLGNHDHQGGCVAELSATLTAGGVQVLAGQSVVVEVSGVEVGVVGVKGFVGGFPGSTLPDFGEESLRAVYAECGAEVDALAEGLRQIGHCALRVALLHYAPVEATLAGEPEGIHTFLGSMRLAQPLAEYRPDLVVHGHAHAGSFQGEIGDVPVYNVAVQVTGRDFWVFELTAERRGQSAVAVSDGPQVI